MNPHMRQQTLELRLTTPTQAISLFTNPALHRFPVNNLIENYRQLTQALPPVPLSTTVELTLTDNDTGITDSIITLTELLPHHPNNHSIHSIMSTIYHDLMDTVELLIQQLQYEQATEV